MMRVEFALRIIGGILAGYGGWQLSAELESRFITLTSGTYLSFFIPFAVAIACFGIAFLLVPYVTTRPFLWLAEQIQRAPASDLVAAAIGLAVGLLIAMLLALPLSQLPFYLGNFLPVVASAVLGYFGMTTMVTHKKEIFALFGIGREARPANSAERPAGQRVILDTSAIIDGRIADITQTGFLPGPLVVPRFVLAELQRIADSPDPLRRNRGRRGLEILNRLQKDPAVQFEVSDFDPDGNLDVDAKLIRMARQLKCAVVTNDYNLNRVAALQGVKVLNINELANAVKSVVLPGEEMRVRIIQEGKEFGQGVAYLDDGTMVVVENGRRYLDSSVDVVVTRVLQTVAGRMIFAQPKSPDGQHR